MDRELITTFATSQAARDIQDRLDRRRGWRRPTPYRPMRRNDDTRDL